jgi:hypothetical protein
MKKNLLMVALGGLLIGSPVSATETKPLNKGKFGTEKDAVCFAENKGQVADQNGNSRADVLFGGATKGVNFHLKKTGVSYQLNRVDKWKKMKLNSNGETISKIDEATVYRLDLKWLNTSSLVKVHGIDPLANQSKFFNNNGEINAASYSEVVYKNIYKGIDLKWYEKNGELEYDYIVAAGADHTQIKFEISGAESIKINRSNDLEIETPLGTIIQKAPLAIQNGKILPSSWKVEGNVISFNVKNVDPSQALVIDPVVRVWGTYYGGTGDDRGWSTTADNNGNVYLVGDTNTPTSTLIATSGSHQTSLGGAMDVFIAKFNSAGVRQWSTYYGGTGNEFDPAAIVDGNGDLYVASYSDSNTGTVIATASSHQPTFGGGVNDAFLVKFDANGNRIWGTYYGGNGLDFPRSVSVDGANNVYIYGFTSSTNSVAMVTAGAHQVVHNGSDEAFLVKFNSSGVRQWATYYGGTGSDAAYGCVVDASGNVYLSGHTTSGTNISTVGSHQTTNSGGHDAFLVKFNNAGARQWATYYGGASPELESVCALDATTNQIYIVGQTTSNTTTLIATPGTHQPTYAGGGDVFIAKFDANGVRQWGTYYGGAGDQNARTAIVDVNGALYFNGRTTAGSTGTSVATTNGFQPVAGGGSDMFFAGFDQNGRRFFGSYYGGTGTEECSRNSMSLKNGNLFISGYTTSGTTTMIATVGSHQTTFNGVNDAFLAKFNLDAEALNFDNSNDIVNLGTGLGTALVGGNKITVEAWVRPTASAGLDCIIGNYNNPNNNMQFLLRKENMTNYRFWIGNSAISSYTSVSSGTVIPVLNVWQHVAGVFDGTVASIYIDGVLTGTTLISLPAFAATTNSVYIGGNGIGENWSGDLDEIRVWNKALCQGEILNNMNGELNLPQTNLVAYYKFNQGIASVNNSTVTTLTDAGPSNFTGTLTGFALNGNTSNWTVPGAVRTGSNVTAFVSPTIAVTGQSVICSGNSTTLTANGNVATYNWVSGPTTASNVVSPSVTATYSVTGTNSLGCVSNMATKVVSVNITPTVAVSNGSICAGNSFTIVPSGASTYTIQGGNAVVSPTANSSYTVNGTSAAGCISANTATSNVTVNANPTISVSNGTICAGKSFTITPNGASTYTIQGGNAVVSPTANASYTVVGTSSAGCVGTNTATANISVNPSPTVNAVSNSSVLCSGESATLTASGAVTYTWNTASSNTSIVVSPTATTIYTVTGVNANGCENTATITQSVSTCAGINESADRSSFVQIYPNPASNVLNVKLSGFDLHNTSVKLTNVLGQDMVNTTATNDQIELNLSNLPNGLYFVRVLVNNKEVVSHKLIKN